MSQASKGKGQRKAAAEGPIIPSGQEGRAAAGVEAAKDMGPTPQGSIREKVAREEARVRDLERSRWKKCPIVETPGSRSWVNHNSGEGTDLPALGVPSVEARRAGSG